MGATVCSTACTAHGLMLWAGEPMDVIGGLSGMVHAIGPSSKTCHFGAMG